MHLWCYFDFYPYAETKLLAIFRFIVFYVLGNRTIELFETKAATQTTIP